MSRPQHNPGFTIVEVIVVTVVLAVLAAAIAPRFTSSSGRRARAEAKAVERTLTAAAMRDAMSSQRVALEFEAGALRVMTLAAAGEDPGAARLWRTDPLIAEARLEELSLVAGAADLERLSTQRFRIELPRVERRPDIELRFTDSRGAGWRATLRSGATRALAGPEVEIAPVASAEVIDLDEIGQERRPW